MTFSSSLSLSHLSRIHLSPNPADQLNTQEFISSLSYHRTVSLPVRRNDNGTRNKLRSSFSSTPPVEPQPLTDRIEDGRSTHPTTRFPWFPSGTKLPRPRNSSRPTQPLFFFSTYIYRHLTVVIMSANDLYDPPRDSPRPEADGRTGALQAVSTLSLSFSPSFARCRFGRDFQDGTISGRPGTVKGRGEAMTTPWLAEMETATGESSAPTTN